MAKIGQKIREIPLGIIYKISNQDILGLPSPQGELSDDICIANANSICARRVITIQNFCHA